MQLGKGQTLNWAESGHACLFPGRKSQEDQKSHSIETFARRATHLALANRRKTVMERVVALSEDETAHFMDPSLGAHQVPPPHRNPHDPSTPGAPLTPPRLRRWDRSEVRLIWPAAPAGVRCSGARPASAGRCARPAPPAGRRHRRQ